MNIDLRKADDDRLEATWRRLLAVREEALEADDYLVYHLVADAVYAVAEERVRREAFRESVAARLSGVSGRL